MASRLDSVQLAVPRSIADAQQQQHAAQRQPVAAQEHTAEHVQQDARTREQRPVAPEGAQQGKVRNELLPEVDPRRDSDQRSRGRRQPRRRRDVDEPAATPTPAQHTARPAATGDGRGSRVDIKL
jgi:hypothetical protein